MKGKEIPTSLQEKYSQLYIHKKAHSPDASIVSLSRRARPTLQTLTENDYVLDLGSGRQNFPRRHRSAHRGDTHPYSTVTVDFATIRSNQLLARDTKNVDHVQADGNCLPFADSTFSAAVSNMALDFMSEDAIRELQRVLKPGAPAFVNLSFPALDMSNVPDLDSLIHARSTPASKRQELLFWKNYLENNEVVIASPAQAVEIFRRNGFLVDTPQIIENSVYDWCEVDMQKKPSENIVFVKEKLMHAAD